MSLCLFENDAIVDCCVKAISLLCLFVFLCLFGIGFVPIILLSRFNPYFEF